MYGAKIATSLTHLQLHEATTEALQRATRVANPHTKHYYTDGSYKQSDPNSASWSCNVIRDEGSGDEPTNFELEGYIAEKLSDSFSNTTVARLLPAPPRSLAE